MVSPYFVLARPGVDTPLPEYPTEVVADGSVTAYPEVPQAGNYAIERSANLSSWTVVGNVFASGPGIIVFEDPAPPPVLPACLDKRISKQKGPSHFGFSFWFLDSREMWVEVGPKAKYAEFFISAFVPVSGPRSRRRHALLRMTAALGESGI